jgi:hypothetical protein
MVLDKRYRVTASYFFAAGLQILNFFSACPFFGIRIIKILLLIQVD